MKLITIEPTAVQKRAAHPDFVSTFSISAIRDRLPLPFPVPEHVPPSPKRHYRSEYRYLGADDLSDPSTLSSLSTFEVALRLIDFSPLRDFLAAACYAPSSRGQVPYDPVSLFLCLCLRRELNLSWRRLEKLLAGEHGVGWRRLFGFQDGVTPSASGLRYFFEAVGEETLEELCPLFIDLIHQAGWLPHPSDDPSQVEGSVSHDLMLHQARSQMRCSSVTETCYQPAPRPCPAREAGKEGCTCSEEACAQICQRATPLDAEARFIHYEGRNKEADLALPPSGGRNVYGYASNPDRLLDDRFACAWTLRTGLYPANADERNLFPQSFTSLRQRFPYLKIKEFLADAALGYEEILNLIWDAEALRMVDIRAAPGDQDPQLQLQRGYDEQGHPLCLHGYQMSPNGHDYTRRRTKWCCEKVCLRDREKAAPACPYQAAECQHGQVVNVGRTLPDGSVRLAREVPYGSPAWKERYGRRNLSESRNSAMERRGLKRLPDFGLSRNRREINIGDFLENLSTLGRLVQEATLLASRVVA